MDVHYCKCVPDSLLDDFGVLTSSDVNYHYPMIMIVYFYIGVHKFCLPRRLG